MRKRQPHKPLPWLIPFALVNASIAALLLAHFFVDNPMRFVAQAAIVVAGFFTTRAVLKRYYD